MEFGNTAERSVGHRKAEKNTFANFVQYIWRDSSFEHTLTHDCFQHIRTQSWQYIMQHWCLEALLKGTSITEMLTHT